jgi:hypothetical protein
MAGVETEVGKQGCCGKPGEGELVLWRRIRVIYIEAWPLTGTEDCGKFDSGKQ